MKKLYLCLLALVLPISAQSWRTAYYFQPFSSRLPITSAPFSKYTHVTQANVLATYNSAYNTCGLDTDSYVLTGHISEFVNAVHGAGAKALVTMMGDSARVAAMQTCTDSAHINQFVSAISNFVNNNGYDGFDLDWEAGIIDTQWENLVRNLRVALPGKVISVSVTVTERFIVAAVQSSLDQANIMNYDRDSGLYTGNWATDAWYNSATLAGGDTNHPTAEMDVQYYIGASVAPSKIGIGLPFYARIKQGCLAGYLSGSTCTLGIFASLQSYASGDASTNPRTAINYNDLLSSTYWANGTKVWDAVHGAQYIQYNAGGTNQAFVPYTGVEQIQAAANYVKTNGLGGIMTYELSGEYISTATGDARYPLSTALYQDMIGGSGTTAPSITPVSQLPAGTVSMAYSALLSATGTGPITWSVASGSLPAGLGLNASTGAISGTPTTAGTSTFTIQASNSIGSNTQTFSLTVNTNSTAPVITTTSPLPAGTVNTAYLTTLSATGTGPIRWSLSSGTLTAGLSLNASTGAISGTPTAAGTSTFTVLANNSAGSSIAALSLTINAPVAGQQSVQLTPNSGSGSSATFTVSVMDGNGYTAVSQVALLVGSSGVNGCYVQYAPATRTIYLAANDGVTWSAATAGSSATLQNSQCSVRAGLVSSSGSGNTFKVAIPIAFSRSYAGSRSLLTFGADTFGLSTGWQTSGAWTVTKR